MPVWRERLPLGAWIVSPDQKAASFHGSNPTTTPVAQLKSPVQDCRHALGTCINGRRRREGNCEQGKLFSLHIANISALFVCEKMR